MAIRSVSDDSCCARRARVRRTNRTRRTAPGVSAERWGVRARRRRTLPRPAQSLPVHRSSLRRRHPSMPLTARTRARPEPRHRRRTLLYFFSTIFVMKPCTSFYNALSSSSLVNLACSCDVSNLRQSIYHFATFRGLFRRGICKRGLLFRKCCWI